MAKVKKPVPVTTKAPVKINMGAKKGMAKDMAGKGKKMC